MTNDYRYMSRIDLGFKSILGRFIANIFVKAVFALGTHLVP